MSNTLITDGETTQVAEQQQTTAQEAATAAPSTQEGTQQDAAGQGAAEQKPGGEQADGDKPQGAPETYEFKAEEGREFDPKVIEAYTEVARELNLSQDAAQKMLDKVAPAIAARQAEQLQAARTAWAEEAKSDKEFGGDRLGENLATAKMAVDRFGTPELRALLNDSGLGNHPEVIRFMVRAGKAISEDKVLTGKGAPTGSKTLADRLYS